LGREDSKQKRVAAFGSLFWRGGEIPIHIPEEIITEKTGDEIRREGGKDPMDRSKPGNRLSFEGEKKKKGENVSSKKLIPDLPGVLVTIEENKNTLTTEGEKVYCL